jgi:hypothetical protein
MKKNLFFLGLILFFSGYGQHFEKIFGNDDRIDMVVVTQEMFSLITEINSSDKQELTDFYNQLTYLGSFHTSDPQAGLKLKTETMRYIQSHKMKLLVKIKDTRKDALLYYIPSTKEGYAKEIVLLVHYSDGSTSLLTVKGKINMKKISLLALQATMIDQSILKEAERKIQ